ncbi:MAG: hypothetical protein PF517_00320 [Salinivirgaceae bacterium]|jgi:hypothetical protein|nr:hypothetical protein [Salinivirgaceae bacterium]
MIYRIILLMLFINSIVIVNSQTTDDSISNEKEYFIKAHTMAANEFNDSLLREYIQIYPEGEYIEKATNNIDICAWQNARYKNTSESYTKYLKDFPMGKAKKLAEQKLASLNDTIDNKE